MVTQRYGAGRWFAGLAAALALLTAGCSSAGESKASALAAPRPGASALPGPPGQLGTQLDRLGSELAKISADPAFAAAARASADYAKVKALDEQAQSLSERAFRQLVRRPRSCAAVRTTGGDAAALVSSASPVLHRLPGEIAVLRPLLASVGPRLTALQGELAAFGTRVRTVADPTITDRLNAYSVSAQALQVNVRGGQSAVLLYAGRSHRIRLGYAMLQRTRGYAAAGCPGTAGRAGA